jgi:hypothetical protein
MLAADPGDQRGGRSDRCAAIADRRSPEDPESGID